MNIDLLDPIVFSFSKTTTESIKFCIQRDLKNEIPTKEFEIIGLG
jgi:hypothetical protein